MLIAARVVQGLGAALMTPQTMAVITRIFPPERRGAAMGLWGAVAGVATLVGPILGGVLVDTLGWEWIFFVNVPVGVVAFVLAWRLVPSLETQPHRFDWLGVVLSAVGMFLLVFGIQEGDRTTGATITGPITVWGLIIGGVVVLAGFVWWQRCNRNEPLRAARPVRATATSRCPTSRSRPWSFAITAMGLPLMLLGPAGPRLLARPRPALMLAPMAVVSILAAPLAGRLTDRVHPRVLTLGRLRRARCRAAGAQPRPGARHPAVAARAGVLPRAWAARSSGPPSPPPPTATSPRSAPAPGPGSTTRRARSAPCSGRPRSPCSSTPAWSPTG